MSKRKIHRRGFQFAYFSIASLRVLLALLWGALWLALAPQRPPTAQESASLAWTAQTSGALARLHAVFFADRARGWIAGSNGTLLATEDGGATWRRLSLAGRESRETLRDLWFFDAQRGLALGEYGIFNRPDNDEPSGRSFLLASLDGGASWKATALARPPRRPAGRTAERPPERAASAAHEIKPSSDAILLRLAFANDRAGWACGEGGAIQATRDGGASWQMQYPLARKLLYDVTAIDERQAWAVGAGGVILRTVDGGQQWNPQPSDTTQTLRAVHFVDARRGWAVGTNGAIIATTNGGNRWRAQNSGTTQGLNDVFFVNATEGWAAGDRGALLHTRDGGATWESFEIRTRANLTRLFFIAPDCGWVVGTSGAIFKYGPGANPQQ